MKDFLVLSFILSLCITGINKTASLISNDISTFNSSTIISLSLSLLAAFIFNYFSKKTATKIKLFLHGIKLYNIFYALCVIPVLILSLKSYLYKDSMSNTFISILLTILAAFIFNYSTSLMAKSTKDNKVSKVENVKKKKGKKVPKLV